MKWLCIGIVLSLKRIVGVRFGIIGIGRYGSGGTCRLVNCYRSSVKRMVGGL